MTTYNVFVVGTPNHLLFEGIFNITPREREIQLEANSKKQKEHEATYINLNRTDEEEMKELEKIPPLRLIRSLPKISDMDLREIVIRLIHSIYRVIDNKQEKLAILMEAYRDVTYSDLANPAHSSIFAIIDEFARN